MLGDDDFVRTAGNQFIGERANIVTEENGGYILAVMRFKLLCFCNELKGCGTEHTAALFGKYPDATVVFFSHACCLLKERAHFQAYPRTSLQFQPEYRRRKW